MFKFFANQKKSLIETFPAPKYLSLSSAGLAISDDDIKFIEFKRSLFKEGLKPVRAERVALPDGVIETGFVNDSDKFKSLLNQLATRAETHYVHVALPEERAYLFTTVIDKVPEESLRDAVAFILEENVPLALEKAVFDIDVLGEVEPGRIKIVVTVLSKMVVEFYTEILESVGLIPVSFDIQSQAIARALVPAHDLAPQLIINLEAKKTGLYVVEGGVVQFSTTLSYDVHDSKSPNLENLKKEVEKTVGFWAGRSEGREIETVLVCGRGSEDGDLISELIKGRKMTFIPCNPWTSPALYSVDPPQDVLGNHLDYSAVIGAALANVKGRLNKLLDDPGRVKISREYGLRRWIVGLGALAFVLLLALIGTMPSYILSSARNQEMQERSRIMALDDRGEEDQVLLTWLADINLKLAALSPELDKQKPSEVFKAMLVERPGGIQITSIIWAPEESAEESEVLFVSGVARDRQALLSFESALNASGNFSEVSVPLSSLARDKDLGFQLELAPNLNP